MYFIYGNYDENYDRDFQNRLDDLGYSYPKRRGIYFFDPVKSPGVVHFDINFTPSTIRNRVDVAINVYDGLKKTATYTQRRLPIAVIDRKSVGRERPLVNEHFYDCCLSILTHRNFWVILFQRRISGYPTAPFNVFLAKALPTSS